MPCYPPAPSRRALYRRAKKNLYSALHRRWCGSNASLRRAIQTYLRGRGRRYLFRLVQRPAFALAVAAALLTGAPAHATSPIELSDIAMSGNPGGFVINGIDAYDQSGRSVSGAGDVNGDGVADLIIGAFLADPGGDSYAGESYVVFGKADGSPVDLSDVVLGVGGFVINGADVSDRSGFSVSAAGDVNGDGLADLIVGAYRAEPGGDYRAGETYVVFGKADGTPVELTNIAMNANTGGFVINGIDVDDRSGRSVSAAGDVNGDGLADLIVGAIGGNPGALSYVGETYVVFGKADGTAVDLANIISGTGGFVINGIDENDSAGFSVSGAGDVNGDGLADLIIGAPGGDVNGSASGESYVVFGKTGTAAVDLADITLGTGGFVINGIGTFDLSGDKVSAAGDVNGDGLADLIVAAPTANPGARSAAGQSYVVFGKAGGTAVELSDVVSGMGGFAINGIDSSDNAGTSISGAGDVNGDGLADLIVGARLADPGAISNAGESYVVFGKASGTPVELSNVAGGTGGFVINGIAIDDQSGRSVSRAGDVNGDGLPDLIIGAPGVEPPDRTAARVPIGAGESYVVFSPETAPSTATYKARSRAGDGAGGDPVVPTVFEDARITIDYSDEDTGDDGSGGASEETITLHRSSAALNGLDRSVANVYWEWNTDRVNWDSAKFTLKYLDSDLSTFAGPESNLVVYGAGSTNGPWTPIATTVDAVRNTVSIDETSIPTFLALSASASLEKWVDFAWTDTEMGTIPLPFNTLAEALGEVAPGGTVAIKGNTLDSDSPETFTGAQVIDQAVRITAVGGPVTIGNSARRDAQRGSGEAPEDGFVSKER